MRRSNWTPTIVPGGYDQTVYFVAADFGRVGQAWRDADYRGADLQSIIQQLLAGEYINPIRVIAFNTIEGWSADVSADVANEIRRRCDLQMREMPSSIRDFVEGHEGDSRQLTLRLV